MPGVTVIEIAGQCLTAEYKQAGPGAHQADLHSQPVAFSGLALGGTRRFREMQASPDISPGRQAAAGNQL
jgi:hypothetical protein